MRRLTIAVIFILLAAWTGSATAVDFEEAFRKGQAAYAENRLDDAVLAFGEAAETLAELKRYDQARMVYGNVAVIEMSRKNWQEAITVYNMALALPGAADGDFLRKATNNIIVCAENIGQGRVKAEAAGGILAAKIQLTDEERLNFLALEGDGYREAESYGLAVRAYEKALALKNIPQDTRLVLLNGLGLALGNLGRYDEALKKLTEAAAEAEKAAAQQSLVEAHSNIGVVNWEMGNYDQAVSALLKAIGLAEDFGLRRNQGVDRNNLGLVYKNSGRLNEAMAEVESALKIAEAENHLRDKAIARVNLALIYRMKGRLNEAVENYEAALAAFDEAGFREGRASALMGLARIDSARSDYPAALKNLLAALAIYEDLDNSGFRAEAYVQLGALYQKAATPQRVSGGLVFEDEGEPLPGLAGAEGLKQSEDYFTRALELAEKTGRREMIWGALHGLAFAADKGGDLVRAEELYAKAIEVVLSMKGATENPELLEDFLKSKDDLFREAIGVCARLYQQNGDQSLLLKQMEYDEIYRNEVVRTNMRLASLEYSDPEKRAIYEQIVSLSASRDRAGDALLKANDPEEKKAAAVRAEKITADLSARLAEWGEKYPRDAVMFDAAAKVDLTALQGRLAENQAIVQYLPLDDMLVIMTVTNETVEMTAVPVTYKELSHLIRDRFIAENIEASRSEKPEELRRFYDNGMEILEEMSSYLYEPVAAKLAGKDRLYIITSKYLSYVPFAGLVTSRAADGQPRFLVEDKTISLLRLSFADILARNDGNGQIDSFNAVIVGDPRHEALIGGLPPLPGAQSEAKSAAGFVHKMAPDAAATLFLEAEATESTWKKVVGDTDYSIFYFATHGVPFAEMLHTIDDLRNRQEERLASGKGEITRFKKFLDFFDSNRSFQNKSHLNGFLYMSYPDVSDDDGVLTLKEIMELPNYDFQGARLAVLSACNTAVSYSPKVIKDQGAQNLLEQAAASEQLAASGWMPGIDQVCLVDTFMRQGFTSVYGTLWFADDMAAEAVMGQFFSRLDRMPPAEALRQAQLEYLKNPPAGLRNYYPQHPFFWACGNIFGL